MSEENSLTLKKVQHRLEKASFPEDKYREAREVMDKRFGKISVWVGPKDAILIVKKRVSQNAEDCLRDVGYAKERLKINQDYIMKMVDYSVKVPALDLFEVWGFYEAPLQDLKREIAIRKKKKR